MTETPERKRKYHSPDGINRSHKIEKQINEAFALAFSGEAGDFVLDYLRRISIERVNGPAVDTNSLLHMEGQRFLVGVIQQRINLGKEKLP
jgi:hypothetical protein